MDFGYDNKKKGVTIEKFKLYPLTYTLMIVNIVIFILPQVITAWFEPLYQWGALSGYWVIVKGELHRLLSSIFLHADMMHIIMNMLSLYMVGTIVERLFSKASYLSIYFLSALFGSFASMYMHLGAWAVGASGAIFGLFGALAGFAFVHRETHKEEFMHFMRQFGVILLLNLILGFVIPDIDVSAHVGGLITGIIGGMILAKSKKYLLPYIVGSIMILVIIYDYLPSLYAHML